MGTGTSGREWTFLAIRCSRRHGGIDQRLAHEQESATHDQQLHVRQRPGDRCHRGHGGKSAFAKEFKEKAARLKQLVQETLWNSDAEFFEVRREDGKFSGAREEIGFIPWCFNLPDAGRESAWSQLNDPAGFSAPGGITTAERRHPQFRSHGVGTCEWDGAVWPFATSQTLIALANVLRDYPQKVVSKRDYFDAFLTYVHSQHAGGKPYIGEYLDEVTGDWINGKGGRSRYYNHSSFADLLITGVVGLRPRADDTVEVSPLLPGTHGTGSASMA